VLYGEAYQRFSDLGSGRSNGTGGMTPDTISGCDILAVVVEQAEEELELLKLGDEADNARL